MILLAERGQTAGAFYRHFERIHLPRSYREEGYETDRRRVVGPPLSKPFLYLEKQPVFFA